MAYDYSKYTKVDSSGKDYSVHRSGYKNIRFALVAVREIIVTQSDIANLPGLSFRIYGDTSYWRILLAFNGLNDPIQDIYVGQRLKVPSLASITQHLTTFKKQARPTFII